MAAKSPDAITLLKADHRAVEALFEKFEKAGSPAKARLTDVDLDALGEKMAARKEALKSEFAANGLPTPTARTLGPVEIKLGEPVA